MGNLTNYSEEKLLKHGFNIEAFTLPVNFEAFLAASVDQDGTINGEPSGNGYARVSGLTEATFNPAAARQLTNAAQIQFPQATGSWGTPAVVGIRDTDANQVLAWADISNPQPITSPAQPTYNPGQLIWAWQAGGIGDYFANGALSHLFGKASFTQPAQIGHGMSTTPVGTDGSNITEPGDTYVRQNITAILEFVAGDPSIIRNSSDITYPEATAAWGNLTHGFVTAEIAGTNLLFTSALTEALNVQASSQPVFPTNGLRCTMD